jgi:hypothetical protein
VAEEKNKRTRNRFGLVSQAIHAFFGSFTPLSWPMWHTACSVFSLQRLGIGVSSCREAQARASQTHHGPRYRVILSRT